VADREGERGDRRLQKRQTTLQIRIAIETIDLCYLQINGLHSGHCDVDTAVFGSVQITRAFDPHYVLRPNIDCSIFLAAI
jgi:hypothetical protein